MKQYTDVLKSKRFIALVVGIVAMLFVTAFPQFEDLEAELVSSITILVALLISGYSVQDAIREFVPTARKVAAITATPYDDQAVNAVEALLKKG